MFKLLMLFTLFCCAGCQTTTIEPVEPVAASPVAVATNSEKLLLRVETLVGTYDVDVQRAVLHGPDRTRKDQWAIAAAASVSGYPNVWRTSDDFPDPASAAVKGTYLLAGDSIEVSLDPGVRMIAKVVPESRNTARVVGVFVHVKDSSAGPTIFDMPFDVKCVLGEVVVAHDRVAIEKPPATPEPTAAP